MNKKQAERLGEIFVRWNNREVHGDYAMYQVQKIFPRITLRAWRKKRASGESANKPHTEPLPEQTRRHTPKERSVTGQTLPLASREPAQKKIRVRIELKKSEEKQDAVKS